MRTNRAATAVCRQETRATAVACIVGTPLRIQRLTAWVAYSNRDFVRGRYPQFGTETLSTSDRSRPRSLAADRSRRLSPATEGILRPREDTNLQRHRTHRG